MATKLIAIRGVPKPREFRLKRPKTFIGRKRGGSIRIPSTAVSRVHCVVICDGRSVRVKDLGSSNGTLVNGSRVNEVEVVAGDQLVVGPVTFLVQINGVPAWSADAVPASSAAADDGDFVMVDEGEGEPDDAIAFVTDDGEPADEGVSFLVTDADVIDDAGGDDTAFNLRDDSTPGGRK